MPAALELSEMQTNWASGQQDGRTTGGALGGWRALLGWRALQLFFDNVNVLPPQQGLPRPAWVRLNRVQTGVGLFRSSMHQWVMASLVSCKCGAEEQTADYIITSYPIYRHPNGIRGLLTVKENSARWLSDTCPAI